MIDLAIRLGSVLAGRWRIVLGLALLGALVAGLLWADRQRIRAAEARGAASVQSRWDAENAREAAEAARAAQTEADRLGRWESAVIEAQEAYRRVTDQISTLSARNRALGQQLRDALAADRDPMRCASSDPAGAEPAGDGLDVRAVARAISVFAETCAASRDGLAAQVNGLIDSWPR